MSGSPDRRLPAKRMTAIMQDAGCRPGWTFDRIKTSDPSDVAEGRGGGFKLGIQVGGMPKIQI